MSLVEEPEKDRLMTVRRGGGKRREIKRGKGKGQERKGAGMSTEKMKRRKREAVGSVRKEKGEHTQMSSV